MPDNIHVFCINMHAYGNKKTTIFKVSSHRREDLLEHKKDGLFFFLPCCYQGKWKGNFSQIIRSVRTDNEQLLIWLCSYIAVFVFVQHAIWRPYCCKLHPVGYNIIASLSHNHQGTFLFGCFLLFQLLFAAEIDGFLFNPFIRSRYPRNVIYSSHVTNK